MGAKLDDVDVEILNNLDLLMNYEVVKDDVQFKIYTDVPEIVYERGEPTDVPQASPEMKNE